MEEISKGAEKVTFGEEDNMVIMEVQGNDFQSEAEPSDNEESELDSEESKQVETSEEEPVVSSQSGKE